MINDYQNIHELNIDYSDAIMELAEHSKNSNDDVKQCMLNQIMYDYNINLKIIKLNLDFTKKLFLKNKKLEQRQSLLDFKYKKKQIDFDYKQNKKKNKHVLYCYKKTNIKSDYVNKMKDKKMLKIELKKLDNTLLISPTKNDED